MKVVSNTSPLAYLILIGSAEVLPGLFGTVTIPRAVYDELSDPRGPEVLRSWSHHPPDWLSIEAVHSSREDDELRRLHQGEREAIQLAEQLAADLILLDEKLARRVATERGLNVMGLLGVLDEAGRRGFVDAHTAVERLSQTSFRASPTLLKWLLDRHGQSASDST